MRVMFMGTPDIAVRCLDALLERHEICCAVTKADKPKGRGGAIAFSKVKQRAIELNIPIEQPRTLKDGGFSHALDSYSPDVIVVVAFGLILPKYVLDFPQYGCINVHASLLPKYRGAAPIQWCIANGETRGGVTTMIMDEGIDTGGMLLKAEVDIPPEMTGGQLHDRYCEAGAALICDTLDGLENGSITPIPQDDSEHSYAPVLTNDNTKIDWRASPQEIANLVRAMNPYPTAHTILNDKKLKVFACRPQTGTPSNSPPGTILSTDDGIEVACNGGSVTITELQLENKKRMPASAFLNGFRLECGGTLG